jgi:AcrR family transcriptional regulator
VVVHASDRTKGERTRATILNEAAQLATIVGLEGLTIGRLASAIGMSKSGLYAHFGSKRVLQLATIDAARETFVVEVLRPALSAPKGIQRLLAMCETYLSQIDRRVFPGGCFFSAAAADVGSWPGPVRDLIAAQRRDWLEILERLALEAQALDQLDRNLAPAQLAFELQALLAAANTTFILHGDVEVFERARQAVRERLDTR